MMLRKRRSIRVIALATVLLAALMGIGASPEMASAGRSGCRADPIVTLTDGTQIQMEASIGASISDVQSIVYTVHAPVGSKVLTILYTDSLLGIKEKVIFYADAPAGQYTTDTIVYTRNTGVKVTVTSRIVSALGLGLASGSASGADRQHLLVQLAPSLLP